MGMFCYDFFEILQMIILIFLMTVNPLSVYRFPIG